MNGVALHPRQPGGNLCLHIDASAGDGTATERQGIAHDRGGYWTLDMKGFLDLVSRGVRWNQLPGNSTYPSTKQVLITSTDVTTSNSAAMYASILSYVANGNSVVENPGQVGQ